MKAALLIIEITVLANTNISTVYFMLIKIFLNDSRLGRASIKSLSLKIFPFVVNIPNVRDLIESSMARLSFHRPTKPLVSNICS